MKEVIQLSKTDLKIFTAIVLVLVFAILFPIFDVMMGLIHALAVHLVWIAYLMIGIIFFFYGLVGKKRKYEFLILGAGLAGIGLMVAMSYVVHYFYIYIATA